MISVAEALARMLDGVRPLPAEEVMLAEASGRVLAADVAARRTQPPEAVSAMDGYAVRHADVATLPATLRRIGSAPAGRPFAGRVGPGETVRIFTGAVVPEGADTVVIQENVRAEQDRVEVVEPTAPGRHIRAAGLDFRQGDVGLRAGRRLAPRDIALAAAMNVAWLPVHRRPRVAILATGDEIVAVGTAPGPGQIIGSSGPALTAYVAGCGGQPHYLGVAADSAAAIRERTAGAAGFDILVTLGGASVGEHDLVREALERDGLAVDFWKIAMRPGKPLMFGRLGATLVLGLPGNPVSTMVGGLLFLRPLLERLSGLPGASPRRERLPLATPLGANDGREDYVRAELICPEGAAPAVRPLPVQDSSMLSALSAATALIVRPPHAAKAEAGAPVEVIRLDGGPPL